MGLLNWLGFGMGKLRIELSTTVLQPGSYVEGTVTFKPKKPLHADKLVIRLQAVRRTTGKNRSWDTIFSAEQVLDGKKSYDVPQEYPFRIQVPQELQVGHMLQTVIKIAQSFLGQRIYWYVEAQLVKPGIDLRSRRYIKVKTF